MPPERPYYLLEPSDLIQEYEDKSLLGRFVTSLRHPVEYPNRTENVDDFTRIIEKYGQNMSWESDKVNTATEIGVEASARPLVKAAAKKAVNQVLDVSNGSITVRILRDPESAFKALIAIRDIKETVDELLDRSSKVYMITGYKVVNSGSYSRTIGGSTDVSVAVTIPNPTTPSISPSLKAGTKSQHEVVQSMKVSKPMIYALRYHVVRRPFGLFNRSKQADLRNVVVHSVADGTYGDDESEEEDTSDLYLSDLSENSEAFEDSPED